MHRRPIRRPEQDPEGAGLLQLTACAVVALPSLSGLRDKFSGVFKVGKPDTKTDDTITDAGRHLKEGIMDYGGLLHLTDAKFEDVVKPIEFKNKLQDLYYNAKHFIAGFKVVNGGNGILEKEEGDYVLLLLKVMGRVGKLYPSNDWVKKNRRRQAKLENLLWRQPDTGAEAFRKLKAGMKKYQVILSESEAKRFKGKFEGLYYNAKDIIADVKCRNGFLAEEEYECIQRLVMCMYDVVSRPEEVKTTSSFVKCRIAELNEELSLLTESNTRKIAVRNWNQPARKPDTRAEAFRKMEAVFLKAGIQHQVMPSKSAVEYIKGKFKGLYYNAKDIIADVKCLNGFLAKEEYECIQRLVDVVSRPKEVKTTSSFVKCRIAELKEELSLLTDQPARKPDTREEAFRKMKAVFLKAGIQHQVMPSKSAVEYIKGELEGLYYNAKDIIADVKCLNGFLETAEYECIQQLLMCMYDVVSRSKEVKTTIDVKALITELRKDLRLAKKIRSHETRTAVLNMSIKRSESLNLNLNLKSEVVELGVLYNMAKDIIAGIGNQWVRDAEFKWINKLLMVMEHVTKKCCFQQWSYEEMKLHLWDLRMTTTAMPSFHKDFFEYQTGLNRSKANIVSNVGEKSQLCFCVGPDLSQE